MRERVREKKKERERERDLSFRYNVGRFFFLKKGEIKVDNNEHQPEVQTTTKDHLCLTFLSIAKRLSKNAIYVERILTL